MLAIILPLPAVLLMKLPKKGVYMSHLYFGKKFIFLVIVSIFLTGSIEGSGFAEEGSSSSDIINKLKNPDVYAKPMARMWFPDATAGIDDNNTIAKQINALARAGFGGVEVTMLSDSSSYTNEQAAYCGWGSESWVKLLKKVFKAANGVEGGFRVDVTTTAHWPSAAD